MDKAAAQLSSQKISREIVSLNASALISLYTIDIANISSDDFLDVTGQIASSSFKFHNQNKIVEENLGTSVWFQGNEFIAAPINVEGFELNAKGTVPQPKLSISVDDTNISLLTLLKQKIFELGDLTGAKVTRQQTFAKFLDARNFSQLPIGFDPDPNTEFPRDIYYIERKSLENKYTIEYELSSNFDVDGVKLPFRIVSANKCMWQYRGCGCLYEYNKYRTTIHGNATLPDQAPPIFTVNDELITEIIGVSNIIDKGEWKKNTVYQKGDAVYLQKNNIKYWFIAKTQNPISPPPNTNYWLSDKCSKNISGCTKRYDYLVNNNIQSPYASKVYPFGGFPGTRKIQLGD